MTTISPGRVADAAQGKSTRESRVKEDSSMGIRLLPIVLLSLVAGGCGPSLEERMDVAKRASWPADVAEWPVERARQSFCIINYTTKERGVITCGGVSVGTEGEVLSCWHLIDAILVDQAGGKVLAANQYVFEGSTYGQVQDRLKQLRSKAVKGDMPPLSLTVTCGNVRQEGAILLGVLPGADVVLIKVKTPLPAQLAVLSEKELAAVKMDRVAVMGISSGQPLCSFGSINVRRLEHQFGVNIPVGPGDSGSPLFSKDGHLIGINTMYFAPDENGKASGLFSPVTAEVISSLGNAAKTRDRTR